MGARGPKPTPTNLKVLRGNPGHRPINKNEPKPSEGAIRIPQWLTRAAKGRPITGKIGPDGEKVSIAAVEAEKEFKRLAPELQRLGLLKAIDLSKFIAYCLTYGQWVEAMQYCLENGTVMSVPTKDGGEYLQQVPQVAIVRNAAKQLDTLGAKFGLSPSDRARLDIAEPKENDGGVGKFLGLPTG